MRLLFFIETMKGGGAERVMAVLTDELAKRGHDITLGTMSSHPPFYPLNERIKLLQIKERTSNSSLSKIIHKSRWRHFIRKTIKNEHPDVVISFILRLNAIVLVSSLFLGVPVIASEHSTFDTKLSLKKRFRRFQINKLADKVTVLTQHDYNYIGNRLKNKQVMPNPLSFEPLSEYNNNRKKSIIAAGSLYRSHVKGFDTLIKVWGQIAHLHPDWELIIAGHGSDEDRYALQKLADEYTLSHQFRLIGQVKDLDKKFRESSIFVLSSREEGFGMVLIEAMSQGCACVSFDCKSGPREIITHNVDGILVEDQNKETMQEALSDLIENKEKREALGKQAIRSVHRFSVKNIADKWEMLFMMVSKGK